MNSLENAQEKIEDSILTLIRKQDLEAEAEDFLRYFYETAGEVKKDVALTIIDETDEILKELVSIKYLTKEEFLDDEEIEEVFIKEIYHSTDNYKSNSLFYALDARGYWTEEKLIEYIEDDFSSFIVRRLCIQKLIDNKEHKNVLIIKSMLKYLFERYKKIEVKDIAYDPETQITKGERMNMIASSFLIVLKNACTHFGIIQPT